MTNELKPQNHAVAFRRAAEKIAGSLLSSWVGEERAREATGRITTAIAAAANASKNPQEFYNCTPSSVGVAIATAALTGIMPSSGSTALAYVFPRAARKGEAPQLQYSLSHRGLNALAKRSKMIMTAVPIGLEDKVKVDMDGQIAILEQDIDNPPVTWMELRGVVVIVRDLESGHIIHRGWVPKKLIEQRRAKSLSAQSNYSPWATWPVEMAIKTAMHYAISRGWCVIDDTEALRALAADNETEPEIRQIEATQEPEHQTKTEALANKLADEDQDPWFDNRQEKELVSVENEPIPELNDLPADPAEKKGGKK